MALAGDGAARGRGAARTLARDRRRLVAAMRRVLRWNRERSGNGSGAGASPPA